MYKFDFLMENFKEFLLIFAILIATILASLLVGYQPFHAILSQQLLSYTEKNISPTNVLQLSVMLQNAIELDPSNCNAYERLGEIYVSEAIAKSNGANELDPNLLGKEIALDEEAISQCPTGMPTLKMDYELARDYSMLGNHEKAIYYLQLLANANPIYNVDTSVLEISDIYFHLGSEYQSLGKTSEAIVAYLKSASSAIIAINSGQQGNAVQAINALLNTKPSTANEFMAGNPIGFGKYTSAVKTLDRRYFILANSKSNPDILLYASSNDGSHWQMQGVLMVSSTKLGTIAIGSGQTAHIIYSGQIGTLLYMNSSEGMSKSIVVDMTKTQPALDVLVTGQFVGVTSIKEAIGANGTVYIACGYTNFQICYITINNGVASIPLLIANNAAFPDITTSKGGDVFVVYNNSDVYPNTSTQVWFIEKTNERWSAPIRISSGNIWSGAASISAQSDGTLNVVYITGTSSTDAKLMYVYRNPNGVWSQPEVIGEGNTRPWIPLGQGLSFGGRTSPAMALFDNKLFVVWRTPEDPTMVVGKVLQDGVWGPIQILGQITSTDYQDSPSIVASPENSQAPVYVLWPENGVPVLHGWNP